MIRKLKSGKYRLYSRRKNRRRANEEISGRSTQKPRRRNTNAPFSTSNGISFWRFASAARAGVEREIALQRATIS
jgi:hypothetical protein